MNKEHWVLCPVCKSKTWTKLRLDTVLENLPLLTLICAVIYGVRQGFDFLLPVTVTILFVPTIFIFYNATAWGYIIVYAVIALVGNVSAGCS